MFNKILIANRGEVAIRVIRACKELEIETIAVYSEADRESLHVTYADEAYCIGPPPPRESYLNMQVLIDTALRVNAEAIHPGYGFLAENADFAEMCQRNGLVFIGPSAENIRELGNKLEARKLMVKAGANVLPGTMDSIKDSDRALDIANAIGYPVIIKAAAGGGGIGMRIVKCESEFKPAFESAQRTAEKAFGDGSLYIEKYLESPRHIEIQILADKKGKTIHLGERECSIQRRHQKLLEEAPSPVVTPELRKRLGEIAIRGVKEAGYISAGTVEFLMDQQMNVYFIEVNTRIQVEHPVTEMITGIDLIKQQIKIAAGEELDFDQEDVHLRGHAIECRINAEDPSKDFAPSFGTITEYVLPGGPWVRVDRGSAYSGYTIPHYYDSLLAKLIVWGQDRNEAIERMKRALDEFIIEGIQTTLPLHKTIIHDPAFMKGDIDTNFIQRRILNVPKINPDEIKSEINTKFIGKEIYYIEDVLSTNLLARELIEKGAKEGTVVIAETQYKARAKMGEVWLSPFGGIWLSVILMPKLPTAQAAKFNLLASVAVSNAIKKLYGLDAKIKWPSDIMIKDKKIAGIFAESVTEQNELKYLILGIGINANVDVASFPLWLRRTATSLKKELGEPVSRKELIKKILEELEEKYLIAQKEGFNPILQEWIHLSYLSGKIAKISTPVEILEGEVIGLAEDGSLIIKLQDIERKIISGRIISVRKK
ncbi:MAG: acetyl-CoA carboxylase biotin carboxylase subunit [Methanocellales archaeon]